MIHLDRNENRYGPAPRCYEKIGGTDIELFISYSKYYTDKITPKLAKIFNFPEDNIILEYGGENILRLIFDHIVGRGDSVLVSDYSWNYYDNQIKRRKGKKIIFKVTKNDDKFSFDIPDLIKKSKSSNLSLILITSPNNPTGNIISLKDLDKLLKSTNKKTLVVLDEAYYGFQENYPQEKLNQLIETYPNLLVLRTFSKLYGLAGLRIGYALCGQEALKKLSYEKRYLGYNRLSEKIAIDALESPDYYKKIKDKINTDRENIFHKINEIKGWKAYKSEANFILIQFPESIKNKLREYLLKNNLSVKFHDSNNLKNILRLTIGKSEENQLFLELIKKFVKNHPNRE